jgi:hypothetical protein
MKVRSLIEKVIGPVLLSIPMTCMHLADGHHSGDHHSSVHQPSYQYSIHEPAPSATIESSMTLQNSMMAQEGTQTQPEGEKGG